MPVGVAKWIPRLPPKQKIPSSSLGVDFTFSFLTFFGTGPSNTLLSTLWYRM